MGKKILVLCLDVIMAPWASYNTPKIELIQYGRHIGKKV